MRARVRRMEEEAKKIEALTQEVEKSHDKPATGPEVDSRSVYVGSVEYSTRPEELQDFFTACGPVKRITIICDKFTGYPKGFAYVEFEDKDSVENAVLLNETEFKGRPLKITPKRTNLPGYFRGRVGVAG